MAANAQKTKDFLVQFELFSHPNGDIREMRIVDIKRYSSDAYFRAAVDNTVEAMMKDPRCAKIPLPLDKYELWQYMILTFNYRDVGRTK